MNAWVLSLLLLPVSSGASQGPADTIAVPHDSIWAADPAVLSAVLAGRIPGVHVAPGPGVGPAGPRLRVRGQQTIGDARAPLVLVDGVRIATSMSGWFLPSLLPGMPRLDDVRAWEIEDVTVVRGAAAAGLYGPEGANGALLVRTRAGRIGSSHWQSFAGVGTTPPFAWPTGFGGFDTGSADSAMRNGGCALQWVAAGSCTQDSIGTLHPVLGNRQLGAAWQRRLGVNVGGGSSRLDYFAGWEFEGDGGIIALAPEEAERLRALGQPVREATRDPDRRGRWTAVANVGVRPSETVELRARVARHWGDARVPPTALVVRGPRLWTDPVPPESSAVMANEFIAASSLDVSRWTGALSASWRPARALTVRALLGHDAIEYDQRYVLPLGEGLSGPGLPADGFSLAQSRPDRTRTANVSAEYAYHLSPRVTATSSIGLEQVHLERDYREIAVLRSDTGGLMATTTLRERRHDHALYVRQRVDLSRRVWVMGAMRRDNFGPGPDAWQPSVSASWLARDGATALRVRAAYGSAIRWPLAPEPERTREATVGVAGSVGRGRATFDLALYDMRSRAYWSSGSVDVDNRGVEVSLGATVVATERLTLTVAAGAWGNRNRIRSMTLPPFILGAQIVVPGVPLGWTLAPGVPPFADADGDGIITLAELDQSANVPPVSVGTRYPTQGGSLTARLSLGAWLSLGATLEYQAGHTLFNEAAWLRCLQRVCRAAVDRGTPLAQQAEVAYRQRSSMFYEDADFAKLRSLAMTLAAPARVAAALRLRAVAVTVTGRNLVTWSGYSGLDPEPVGPDPAVGSAEAGSDGYAYPALPQWSLMVRLTY